MTSILMVKLYLISTGRQLESQGVEQLLRTLDDQGCFKNRYCNFELDTARFQPSLPIGFDPY